MTLANPSRPASRPYRIGLYWDARHQSLLSYARSLLDCIDHLKPRSPDLARWFIRDAAGATPLRDPAVDQLTAELEANRREWNLHGTVYAGHHATLTNARTGEKKFDLQLTCGITIPSTTVWFANQLHVKLSGPSATVPDVPGLEQLLELFVEDFAPAWATVLYPRAPDREVEEIYRGVPHVGWFTVFSPEYPTPISLPDRAEIRLLRNGWWWVRTVGDWFNRKIPDHIESLQRTKLSLEQAGALRPRL